MLQKEQAALTDRPAEPPAAETRRVVVIPIKGGKFDRARTIGYKARTKQAMKRLGLPFKWAGVPRDDGGYIGEGRRLADSTFRDEGKA